LFAFRNLFSENHFFYFLYLVNIKKLIKKYWIPV
jgi:hypothetical protein